MHKVDLRINSTPAPVERCFQHKVNAKSPVRNRPLAHRVGVHEAALIPQVVEPARQFHGAAGADVAFEHFAVVAARLDRANHPVPVETEKKRGQARFNG